MSYQVVGGRYMTTGREPRYLTDEEVRAIQAKPVEGEVVERDKPKRRTSKPRIDEAEAE